jgi:hypothetical protein
VRYPATAKVRVALRLRPWEASLIAAHEIAEEFFSNSRRLDDAQRAWIMATEFRARR